jgi:hypothetical protein
MKPPNGFSWRLRNGADPPTIRPRNRLQVLVANCAEYCASTVINPFRINFDTVVCSVLRARSGARLCGSSVMATIGLAEMAKTSFFMANPGLGLWAWHDKL